MQEEKAHTSLPVLCMENGMAILQFSEIFGVHDSLKKKEKRDSRYCSRRGACPTNIICASYCLYDVISER